MVRAFQDQHLEVTVIDPAVPGRPDLPVVPGVGTEAEPLSAAGIHAAAGIVAGTDDDVNNVSIVVTARELNPSLFTIVRQNLQANRSLFDAFDADVTMVSSELIASECLAVVRTPLLEPFLERARCNDRAWASALIERLRAALGDRSPAIWSVALNISEAPAMYRLLMQGGHVQVADLLRNEKVRDYVVTGRDAPSSWLWQRLVGPRSSRPRDARAP